jgi:hypothetical protein
MTSAIVKAVNLKRMPSNKGGEGQLPVRVAVLLPSVPAELALRWRDRRETVVRPVNLDTLLAATDQFHRDHWWSQAQQLEPHVPKWWFKAMTQVMRAAADQRGTALIRLGKYCSAESKTTRDRKIKIMMGRSKSPEHRANATTFWLAGDEGDKEGLPFGWALLEPIANPTCTCVMLQAMHANLPWSEFIKLKTENLAVTNTAPPIAEGTADYYIDIIKQSEATNRQVTAATIQEILIRARGLDQVGRSQLRSWIRDNLKNFVKDSGQRKKTYDILNRDA